MSNDEFHSQFFEDKWLVRNNIFRFPGFFLDIAAGDWKRYSNTLYFERNRWDGICVEADPRSLIGLIENRKQVVSGVIVPKKTKGLTSFYINSGNKDVSSTEFQKDQKVLTSATFTASDLIKKFKIKKVDLLSLDIEGIEAPILKEILDFPILPTAIIVEFLTVENNHSELILKMMENYPYTLRKKTHANFIFTKK